MPITTTIESPHRFKERILGFGEGGAGKSTAVLNMARYMPYAHFWVIDTDISFAYDRLLALEYQDVDERNQVTVLQVSEWNELLEAGQQVNTDANQTQDVLVIDNGTFPWAWVQEAHLQAQYGVDHDDFLSKLRKQHGADNKAYAKDLAEGMQWPVINKKFNKGFYQLINKWKGHAIVMAESKSTRGERDQTLVDQFQVHGAMPKGQGDLSYVMATNVLFMTRPNNTWAISTTKDRGRNKVEKLAVEEFARDYLVDIGGWQLTRTRT